MRALLLLFIVLPLVETYLLLWLSRETGFGTTVAITLVTGIVGSALAKRQGLAAYRKWRQSLETMTVPEIGLVESLLILLGGVLLITPGVITDVCGFLLLVPVSRKAVARVIKSRLGARFALHTVVASGAPDQRPARRVVEGTGESLDER